MITFTHMMQLKMTLTCDPKWVKELDPNADGQRVDLISRAFNIRLRRLINLIKEKEIFGPIHAYSYCVEWQKR